MLLSRRVNLIPRISPARGLCSSVVPDYKKMASTPPRTFSRTGSKEGELDKPRSICINSKGEMIVTEFGNHRLSVFTSNGEFDRCLYLPNRGRPSRVALDHSENLVVTDTNNHAVHVISSEDGKILNSFGGFGSIPGKLNEPRGVAVGPEGQIVVADNGNCRMQVFDPRGNPKFHWGASGDDDRQFSNMIRKYESQPAVLFLHVFSCMSECTVISTEIFW